jgi:hypothetical protein
LGRAGPIESMETETDPAAALTPDMAGIYDSLEQLQGVTLCAIEVLSQASLSQACLSLEFRGTADRKADVAAREFQVQPNRYLRNQR